MESTWKDYPKNLTDEQFIAKEYPQLLNTTYVDHAGATTYSTTQINKFAHLLTKSTTVFGNPHSNRSSHSPIENVRMKILEFFGVDSSTHSVIFNSGATAGLKTVGECFPFTETTTFLHTTECHTSVLGIREYAMAKGSSVRTVPMDGLHEHLLRGSSSALNSHPTSSSFSDESSATNIPQGLLAFPAECNFSGNRSNLNMIKEAKKNHWYVLLDAAKYVSTSELDLSIHLADFVVVSFYKMFGYPTGLGALIVRNESMSILKRTYFGGGTLAAASSESYNESLSNDRPFSRFVDNPSQRYEDGTINYLSILSLIDGLILLTSIGIRNISKHVQSLSFSLSRKLQNLKHRTTATSMQSPVCIVYGRPGEGSIVTFNVIRPNGTYVGYSDVGRAAKSMNIQLRTGCFCNPGACQIHLNMHKNETRENYNAGHVCSDDVDIINERPTGAVRISFGYTSTMKDVDQVVNMIQSHFQQYETETKESIRTDSVDLATTTTTLTTTLTTTTTTTASTTSTITSPPSVGTVKSIHIYPIKSCDGIRLSNIGDRWSFGNSGLQYDREWAVVAPSPSATKGSNVWRVLRQKSCAKLCTIKTSIDENNLIVTAKGHSSLHIPLLRTDNQDHQHRQTSTLNNSAKIDLLICGRRCTNLDASNILQSCTKKTNDWFTNVLGRTCKLVRMPNSNENTSLNKRNGGDISFSNEQQILLVNSASVEDLQSRILQLRSTTGVVAPMVSDLSFRPNIVIDHFQPFEENTWKEGNSLIFNTDNDSTKQQKELLVSKACVRCSMVNRDPLTGGSIPDVLHSLSVCYFKRGGTVKFGRYLRVPKSFQNNNNQHYTLEVGCSMNIK
jgi:molybdenum cofactor sulfurtransferase